MSLRVVVPPRVGSCPDGGPVVPVGQDDGPRRVGKPIRQAVLNRFGQCLDARPVGLKEDVAALDVGPDAAEPESSKQRLSASFAMTFFPPTLTPRSRARNRDGAFAMELLRPKGEVR